MLIEWNDGLKLGVPEVDHEHKTLIEALNLLAERLESGCGRAETLSTLGTIQALIEGHFALEEKIMRETRFEGYPAHKQDHDRLLEDIRDIQEAVSGGTEGDVYPRLATDLDKWFNEHFRTLDKSFHTVPRLNPVQRK